MYQQLILIGHLGNNPELRQTPSGLPVANFNLAVSRRWTTSEGQAQEKTVWFRITAWRRQAELASQYLTKGSRVMLVGEIESARPWTDRDGNLRASIEIVANEIRFLDSRSNERDGSSEEANGAGKAEEQEAVPSDIPF